MPQETIEGIVEDIIFRNEENGYTVLSLTLTKHPTSHSDDSPEPGDEVVVIGRMLEIQPGESVKFSGSWTFHREYGQQFKADTMHLLSDSQSDLERFLLGGQITGIGKETAKKIVDHFGSKAIEILDQNPSRIVEVSSLATSRAKIIAKNWEAERKTRRVLVYLQNLNITGALAQKIFDKYGEETIDEIEQDPYKLAIDVEGVGFKVADQIALQLGMTSDSIPRAQGGVIFALNTLANEGGHIFVPRPALIEKASQLLGVEPSLCEAAIKALVKRDDLAAVKKMPTSSGTVEAVYSHKNFHAERDAAEHLLAIRNDPKSRLEKIKKFDWAAFFGKIAKKNNVELTEQQQGAVQAALTNKISVLTGGPGTGKTTTLRAVIQALDEIKVDYALASPTGRAARRLSEATQRSASTIHRLLAYSQDGEFGLNADNPIDADMIIVDEASMIDLELFGHLLDAINSDSHLMLVGDVDQLPSVGAGDVLHDVIRSNIAHVTRLDAIFRQANDSLIVVNAHNINHGQMPDLSNNSTDFFMFGAEEAESDSVIDLLVDVVQNRIPNRFGLDPLNEVQVLAPMYKGEVGIHALNEQLQRALNPLKPGAADHMINGKAFRLGDKVIQTRNNYEKDVYNGDIGRITDIDPMEETIEVDIDGRSVQYRWKETGDLFLAYAISIHRSQGAEYPAIVMPVVTQHARMLQRNLLYTGITRAKKLVVMVGTRRAVQMAVANDRVTQRYSGMLWQLETIQKEKKEEK